MSEGNAWEGGGKVRMRRVEVRKGRSMGGGEAMSGERLEGGFISELTEEEDANSRSLH